MENIFKNDLRSDYRKFQEQNNLKIMEEIETVWEKAEREISMEMSRIYRTEDIKNNK